VSDGAWRTTPGRARTLRFADIERIAERPLDQGGMHCVAAEKRRVVPKRAHA